MTPTKPKWTAIKITLGQMQAWDGNPRFSTKAQALRIIASEKKFGRVIPFIVSPFDESQRAVKTVYYACPRCGKPKNGRGRSDRVLCNSCAMSDKWNGWLKDFGDRCRNKSYEGFTAELKEYIRARQNSVCALCGDTQAIRKLHVHHIDYDKKHSHPENLIALCRKCHMKTNFHREYWEQKCRAMIAAMTN